MILAIPTTGWADVFVSSAGGAGDFFDSTSLSVIPIIDVVVFTFNEGAGGEGMRTLHTIPDDVGDYGRGFE